MLQPMDFPESSALMEHSRSFMNLLNIPSEGDLVSSVIPGGVNPTLPTTPSNTPLHGNLPLGVEYQVRQS